MTKNKKLAGILAGVLAISVVAGSFAYYNAEHEVDNAMSTSKYGDELTEVFTPNDDWKPGETADKIVGVTNTGDSDIVVRIKMSETWTFGTGEGESLTIDSTNEKFKPTDADTSNQLVGNDGLTANDGSVVYKKLAESGWIYNSADGYWYYNSVLEKDQSTSSLLESITLCDDTDMGKYTETTYYAVTSSKTAPTEAVTDTSVWSTTKPTDELDEGQYLHVKSISGLESGKEGYAGADYVLTIISETCQATDDAILATFAQEGTATATTAPTVTWWPAA